MRSVSCLMIILFLSQHLYAQTAAWVNKVEGNGNEIISSHCSLSGNRSVIAGSYDKHAGITFTSPGKAPLKINAETTKQNEQALLYNMFLAEYDSKGDMVWALHSKGVNAAFPYKICSDNMDHIIVCGSYNGDLILPSLDGNDRVLEGSKELQDFAANSDFVIYNYFVAEYSSKGNLLWYKTALCKENFSAVDVQVDKNNNVYVKAYCYTNAVTIGDFTLLNDSRSGRHIRNFHSVFIKYDPEGKEQWVTYGDMDSKNMQLNKDGHLCFLSSRNNMGALKNTDGSVYVLSDIGYDEEAEIELNENGNVKAVKKIFSGVANLYAHNYVYDSSGNYYALFETNYYKKGDIRIGDKIIPVTETDPSDGDVFLVKFAPDHKPVWYAAVHGEYIDKAFDLVLDKDQQPVVAGIYHYETVITDAFHKDTVLSKKRKSFYIAAFSTTGKLIKAEDVGLRSYRDLAECLSLSITQDNRLFINATISQECEVFGHRLSISGKTGFWPNYDTINGTPGIHEYCDSYFTTVSLPGEIKAQYVKNMIPVIRTVQPKVEDQQIFTNDDTKINSVFLYPNPVTESNKKINIIIKVPGQETIAVQLTDQNGKELQLRSEKLNAGKNMTEMYLTGYAAGLYYIRFIFKAGTETRKIILL